MIGISAFNSRQRALNTIGARTWSAGCAIVPKTRVVPVTKGIIVASVTLLSSLLILASFPVNCGSAGHMKSTNGHGSAAFAPRFGLSLIHI